MLNRKEYLKKYYQNNKSKLYAMHRKRAVRLKEETKAYKKEYHLKKKYNLTIDEFNRRLASTNGICQLCLRRFSITKIPCIDHIHGTKIIRGIICRDCNAVLGKIYDDPNIAARMEKYLS